jgi:hypothetical protein
MPLVVLVHRSGDTAVVSEVANDSALNFTDSPLEKHGLENAKWILASKV